MDTGAVVVTSIAHRDVAQVARAAVKHQPRPLAWPAVRRRGEGDRLRSHARRLQVALHLQLGVGPSLDRRSGLNCQSHPRRDGQVALQLKPCQARSAGEGEAGFQGALGEQQSVGAVAGEGVAAQRPVQVKGCRAQWIRTVSGESAVRHPRRGTVARVETVATVVLKGRIGDGDDTTGIEAVAAVVLEGGVGNRDRA